MAKIVPGALISDIRNAQGTIVFSRNRAGLFSRARVTPANPNTTLQSTFRGFIRTNGHAWGATLTAAQRNTWITLADRLTHRPPFGGPFRMTGFLLFMQANFCASLQGVSLRTTANLSPTFVQIKRIAVTASVSAATFTLLAYQVAAAGGQAGYVRCGPPLSAGRYSNSGLWSTMVQAFTLPGSTLNMWAAFVARYGAPVAGQKSWVQVRGWTNTTWLPGPIFRQGFTWGA